MFENFVQLPAICLCLATIVIGYPTTIVSGTAKSDKLSVGSHRRYIFADVVGKCANWDYLRHSTSPPYGDQPFCDGKNIQRMYSMGTIFIKFISDIARHGPLM